jgi:hypothetical protein
MFKLNKLCSLPVISFAFLLIFPGIILAEETITITTYYPSPYGVYREMRAKRIAIGDTYYDAAEIPWEETDGDGGIIDYLADLVVEGNVGIGTTNPETRLEITGNDSYGVGIKLNPTAAGGGIWWLFAPTTSAGADRAGHLDFTTGTTLSDIRIGIGTTSVPLKLTVRSPSSSNGAALFTNASYSNVFSILPHSGITYLSSGIYYLNGVWTQSNENSNNQLFGLSPGNGARWYASSTGTPSWNLASNIQLWTDAGTWVGSSSRKLKENFTQLNPDDLLNKINQLDITRWNFKSEGKKITHIGPVAEDFYRIFKTGDAEDHLATIDTAGVSLAGVKALSGKVKSQQEQIKSQQQQIEKQQKQIEELKLHNRQLEERLNSVEEKIKKPLK